MKIQWIPASHVSESLTVQNVLARTENDKVMVLARMKQWHIKKYNIKAFIFISDLFEVPEKKL